MLVVMSDADWPERTNWDVQAQSAWTERRRTRLAELATKQRTDVERETQRVPDDPVHVESERAVELADLPGLKRVWRNPKAPGRCKACGQKEAWIEIPDWRDGYRTYRCRFCLDWAQARITTYSGGD